MLAAFEDADTPLPFLMCHFRRVVQGTKERDRSRVHFVNRLRVRNTWSNVQSLAQYTDPGREGAVQGGHYHETAYAQNPEGGSYMTTCIPESWPLSWRPSQHHCPICETKPAAIWNTLFGVEDPRRLLAAPTHRPQELRRHSQVQLRQRARLGPQTPLRHRPAPKGF